jgi:hypothetical protein
VDRLVLSANHVVERDCGGGILGRRGPGLGYTNGVRKRGGTHIPLLDNVLRPTFDSDPSLQSTVPLRLSASCLDVSTRIQSP